MLVRLLAVVALCWPLVAASAFSADRYLAHVKYLSSDGLKGRGTGTKGLLSAEHYIAREFQQAGLQPAGSAGYLQPFTVTTKTMLAPGNALTFAGRKVASTDFVPLDVTSSLHVHGAVVFAGYGITAPEYQYDDYAGSNATGKVVVILPYEPQEFDDHSVFQGRAYTRHSEIDAKVTNAKLHGAIAVIIAADRPVGPSDGDKLTNLDGNAAPHESGIPVLQTRVAVIRSWLQASGHDLDAIVKNIDKTLKNETFAFPDTVEADVRANIRRLTSEVHNVIGYVPGETEAYIVVGAHYDHIGLGGRFSMAPAETGHVHHGADDNASGTAALLELARYWAKQPKHKRGVLFIAFASEELGLLGSAWWTDHATRPLSACDAMLNMDMVGRLRNEKLYLGGGTSARQFPALIDSLRATTPIQIDAATDATSAGSDHTSFLAKRIPYLFFFTGLHGDYHRPSDTWDKVNGRGAVEILDLVATAIDRLTNQAEDLEFVTPSAPTGTTVRTSGGYGPSFGCVPDMGESSQPGVRCTDFRAGSPAALGGLQANDVLIEFDGKPISNLEDFTYVLQSKKPGDEVKVKVIRAGQPVEATVTLVARH